MTYNENIKNIVFDLGDVILNINVPLAYEAFATLSGKSLSEIKNLVDEKQVFQKYETGQLTDSEFRDYVRDLLDRTDLTDAEIDAAWNCLLLDVPAERIALLRQLRSKYRLFLLSNTSHIHVIQINKIISAAHGISSLNELFEIVFLSYEMGVMKPHASIYEKVLEQAGIQAENTLFLDDNLANIEGAKALGIQTIHVQKPTTIVEYLKEYAQ